MKILLVSVLMVGVSALAAQAESFTFTSTSTLLNSAAFAAPGETPVLAAFVDSKSKTTYAGGKVETNDASCASWSAPPASIFQTNGVCNFTTAGGEKASILFGCNPRSKDQTESDCWGGLLGVTGARAGKSGTISWHQKLNADGKGGAANGVGQWND